MDMSLGKEMKAEENLSEEREDETNTVEPPVNGTHEDIATCNKIEDETNMVGPLVNGAHKDIATCNKIEEETNTIGPLMNGTHKDIATCNKIEEETNTVGSPLNGTHKDLVTCNNIEPVMGLIITNLDELVVVSEILEAVEKALPGSSEFLMVNSLTKGFANVQTAIVSVPESWGLKLLALKTVRIGCVNCRVKLWIIPPIYCTLSILADVASACFGKYADMEIRRKLEKLENDIKICNNNTEYMTSGREEVVANVKHDLPSQEAVETKQTVMVLSEFHRVGIVWVSGISGGSVRGFGEPLTRLRTKHVIQGRRFIGKEVCGYMVVNVHLPPNNRMKEFLEDLRELESTCHGYRKKLILAGVLNAKSFARGSPVEDERGTKLADWAMRLGLVPIDITTYPTCMKVNESSVVDIVLCGELVIKAGIKSLMLLNDKTPDHKYLVHRIGKEHDTQTRVEPPQNDCEGTVPDKKKLTEKLNEPTSCPEEDLEKRIEFYYSRIIGACDSSKSGNKRPKRIHKFWWTEEIASLRIISMKLRRRSQRMRKKGIPDIYEEAVKEHVAARKNLRAAIQKTKARAWQELRDLVDKDLGVDSTEGSQKLTTDAIGKVV